jgi:predicted aspartyl protease
LATSRFGVVVLSRKFFEKEWPQRELDGLTSREIGGGKVILPVWHNISYDEVARYSPVLADRIAIPTTKGIAAVADAIVKVVKASEDLTRISPDQEQHSVGGRSSLSVEPQDVLQRLGIPVTEALPDSKGRFKVPITLAVPGSPNECVVDAIIDTGAAKTAIPSNALEALGIQNIILGTARARSVFGSLATVRTCIVDLTLGPMSWKNVDVVVLDRRLEATLGQDILSEMIVMLDGGAKRLRLWPIPDGDEAN